jgi:hypothetical protein
MIPLWKGKNPIYFGVIRSKVKVTITLNRIFDNRIVFWWLKLPVALYNGDCHFSKLFNVEETKGIIHSRIYPAHDVVQSVWYKYIQWNLSNPTYQGTREMCRIVQDVRTCLILHTKGPGKCVGLTIRHISLVPWCVGLDRFWHPVQSDTFPRCLGV